MASESMIERVAKTISGAPFPTKASLRKAPAAVEAMREATVEMSSQGQRVIDADDAAWPSDAVWLAMIDAILSESSPPGDGTCAAGIPVKEVGHDG